MSGIGTALRAAAGAEEGGGATEGGTRYVFHTLEVCRRARKREDSGVRTSRNLRHPSDETRSGPITVPDRSVCSGVPTNRPVSIHTFLSQSKGRTMATAMKLSVPKPVNLPSMKKVRGGRGATQTRCFSRKLKFVSIEFRKLTLCLYFRPTLGTRWERRHHSVGANCVRGGRVGPGG